jgi:hypothetical protein
MPDHEPRQCSTSQPHEAHTWGVAGAGGSLFKEYALSRCSGLLLTVACPRCGGDWLATVTDGNGTDYTAACACAA